ncbi:MAG: acylneuraminate cytidylyltransferase [Chloroflexi bacterium RBG_16_48_8]|nr:MAG: acylneuraminate cytidylyltransferase [Chloroflexi bacterium RBG_16_48_8]
MPDKEKHRSMVALVPMRHHSVRVPGKNYRDLAGKPLYAYILGELLKLPEISEIVVDTDSPIISDGVRDSFPSVRIIDRPGHLREDTIPMNEILLHDTEVVPAKYYLQTHSTNPLLRSETIRDAIKVFHEHYPERDSLFGVTRYQTRLWDAKGVPVNHDPDVLLRTQDLPPLFEENSCIYIFERETFVERKNRLGGSPMMFEIDPYEALDIDSEIDFTIVECLLRKRIALGREKSYE